MKKLTLLSGLIIFIVATAGAVMMPPQSASAAPAQCYSEASDNGDAPFKAVPCSELNILIKLNNPTEDLKDDMCYLRGRSGWTVTDKQPIGSASCNLWSGKANEVAAKPAECAKVSATITEFQTGQFSSNRQINRGPCGDDLADQIAASGYSRPTFQAGTCYLIFLKDGTTEADHKYDYQPGECNELLRRLITAQQITPTDSVIPNPDRDQARTCDGQGSAQKLQDCLKKNPIIVGIERLINIAAGLVGVTVVVMVILGGLQYASASDNPQQVAAAKKRIINALLSFIGMLLLYAFLQWVVPGGVF